MAVGFGLFPLGLAFGVLLTQSGLAWWWAPVFSMMIYAGSLEFLAIGLLLAMTPLAQVALTAFMVNFRHVFYALSFPLHKVRGRLARTYSMYALTDESYAVTATRPDAELTGGRVLGIQMFCQLYWVGGGIAGALAGLAIPGRVEGLDFALTALFAVLSVDAFRVRRDIPTPVLALGCAIGALFAPSDAFLVVAMGAFTAVLLARYGVRRARLRRSTPRVRWPEPDAAGPEAPNAREGVG
ncbi:AzlC family ABC transporter permease [Tomitella fengzijianii]|uniref:AzlC family ABC transporter permease n=1 Tax=Tomitella fengzijianii TaxID=2597660 RepID=UPI001E315A34|nr:AzlC family ABC transporter permease [Tomitella fengzijianii]